MCDLQGALSFRRVLTPSPSASAKDARDGLDHAELQPAHAHHPHRHALTLLHRVLHRPHSKCARQLTILSLILVPYHTER